MAISGNSPSPQNPLPAVSSRLLDWIWVVTMLVLMVLSWYAFGTRNFYAYMGTDFRGYYTSAQIALERGFASVYDHGLQSEYQSSLSHPWTLDTLPPMERVSVPYLPIFILLFLPLSGMDFTLAYLLWAVINLGALVFYLFRFSKALGVSMNAFRLLQWLFCLPVVANLYLGQINVLLLICLGEFMLALLRDRPVRGGLWLSGMLIKPHTLILLLPGLLISRRWEVIRGFLAGALIIAGGSIAVAGLDGVMSSFYLTVEFASPLIQTAATMMNWRSLALNLSVFIPDWSAWTAAIAGMVLVATLVLYLWLRRSKQTKVGSVLIVLATYAGTLTISWHSHFYLLMPLIPLLIYLDGKRMLPLSVRSAWLLGPPIWYILVYLGNPSLVRNWFGLGMLALSLYLLAWTSWRLLNSPDVHNRGSGFPGLAPGAAPTRAGDHP
jgi:hypothetical protein